jgi:hypothetical protein
MLFFYIYYIFGSFEFINSISGNSVKGLEELISDFKMISMNYAEPFLEEVKIREFKMEGFVSSVVIPPVSKAMIDTGKRMQDAKFEKFGEDLGKSHDIQQRAFKLRSNSYSPAQFDAEAKKLEEVIFSSKRIIFPVAWNGPDPHAMLMIVEPSGEKFKLVLANTGMGVNYHIGKSDENGIVPLLMRTWKVYDGISREYVTEANHWFIQALGLLYDNEYMMKSNTQAGNADKYFYSTILANFELFESEQYVSEIPANDDRFIRSQGSGSCAYSSLMAGLLYDSSNKKEYLRRRFIYGQVLLENFLEKYVNSPLLNELLSDAYEPMARYLMKHMASGIAMQTLEFLESEFPEFKSATLIGASRSNVLETKDSSATVSKLNNFRDLDSIKYAITLALRVYGILSITSKSAIVAFPDVSKSKVEVISDTEFKKALYSLGKTELENLEISEEKWPGQEHPFIKSEAQYPKDMPKIIDTIELLQSILRKIFALSSQLTHVDLVMGTYLYDFFRASKPYSEKLIKKASPYQCREIMNLAKEISRNFFAESIHQMTIEDIAANTQLLLLTWRAAVRFDEFQSKTSLSYIGLKEFAAPISGNHKIFIKQLIDPNGSPVEDCPVRKNLMAVVDQNPNFTETDKEYISLEYDTCSAYPGWLSTENEYEAWEMFQDANFALDSGLNDKTKSRFMDPTIFYPDPVKHFNTVDIVIPALIEKFREFLNRVAEQTKHLWSLAQRAIYNNHLYTGQFFALTGITTKDSHPHFHDLMDVAVGYYIGPWTRPSGTFSRKLNVFAPLSHGSLYFATDIREEKARRVPKKSVIKALKDIHLKRNLTPFEIIKYNEELSAKGASNDFYLRQFMDIRSSEAFQSPQSIVRLYSYLSFIEDSKSCSFFANSALVFIADRLFGIKKFFIEDAKLSQRILDSLNASLDAEMDKLITSSEVMSKFRIEQIVNRMVQQSFVLFRFLIRLNKWDLIKSDKVADNVMKLYALWEPLASLNSKFQIPENNVAKINLLLWSFMSNCKKMKLYSSSMPRLVQIKSEYPDTTDDDGVSALISYHYFMAKAFLKTKKSANNNFDLVMKTMALFRFPSQCSSMKEAQIVAELVKTELVGYFGTKEEKTELVWKTTIDASFDILEFKTGTSQSSIPFAIVRLSTGKIVSKGYPIIQKAIIFENPNFLQFFDEEDQKYAQNGQMIYLGETNGYAIEDFRGTGKSYYFVTSGIESLYMDVYFNFEDNWWLWSKSDASSTEALVQSVRLMNLEGIRIFYRLVDSDGSTVDAIFIKDEDSQPILRIKVDKAKTPLDSSITVNLRNVDGPLTLLSNAQYKTIIPTALYQFARPEFISAYRSSSSRIVITFGPYRSGNDEFPITFEEKKDSSGKSIFVWTNFNTWCLDEDQSINSKGTIIPGTLKIRSLDGSSRAILLPNFEWKKEYKDLDYFRTSIIPVEMIKLSDGDLLPKERSDRFALAYKCIIGLQTDLARQLLHPITSIDQNTPFDEADYKIISWIITCPKENPEIIALRMMTASLVAINLSIYPSRSGSSNWTKEKLTKMLEGTASKYFMFVREISEKFYVHRIFPEIFLQDDLFSALFKGKEAKFTIQTRIPQEISESTFANKARLIVSSLLGHFQGMDEFEQRNILNPRPFDKNNFDFSKPLNEETFLKVILQLNTDDFAQNYFKLHAKQGKIRQIEVFRPEVEDYEALIICASLNPKNREFIYYNLLNIGNIELFIGNFNLMSSFFQQCLQIFTPALRLIAPKDLSLHFTQVEFTRSILVKDIKSRSFEDQLDWIPSDKFVQEDEISLFDKLVADLEKIFKTKSSNDRQESTLFSEKQYVKNSPILNKLIDSIRRYTETDIFDGSVRVNLEVEEVEIFKALQELNSFLKTQHKKLSGQLTELFTGLGMLTKTDETAPDFNLITELNILAHLKKKKTFSNLYGCYYSYSLSCFKQKFPHLKDADVRQLREDTFKFYSSQVLHDYYKTVKIMVEAVLEKTEKGPITTLDELSGLVEELKKLSTFDVRVRLPGVLNFEFRSSKYRLRAEQLNDLALLQEEKGDNFKSTVIQRMMAAGKTLVLGTLGTVLKARKRNILSILVPPASLFQSNSASMQSRTYSYFKSRGNVMSFERLSIPGSEGSAKRVLKHLKWLRFNLDETIKSRNYLVMSPGSLQSFLNSYVEFLDNYKASTSLKATYEAILTEFAFIYDIFNRQTSVILDEIDMTMNPKLELNYPTVDRETYNLIAVALTTDLVEWTVFSRRVRTETGLNIIRNNQAGLTDSDYAKLRDLWLEYIREALNNPQSLWSRKLLHPAHEGLTEATIMDFLASSEAHKHVSWIESIQSSEEHAEQAMALVILKVQMDRNMKEAFRSTVKEHYGPAGRTRRGIKFAVPYVAANTPSESSLFADRWETLNKSLLMWAIVSLDEGETVEFLLWLKEQINVEAMTAGTPENTATFNNFSSLIANLNPLSIDVEDYDSLSRIRRALKRKTQAAIRLLFSYHLDTVIAKLNFPREQITANALHLTSMFSSVQGYSGTIDNVNILPSEVVAESYKDHLENERNNGAIIRKLVLDSAAAPIVPQVQNMDSVRSVVRNVREIVKALHDRADPHSLSALIDAGAFLKNFRNSRVAEALLKVLKQRIKCVLYYDEQTNMLQFVHYRSEDEAGEDDKLGHPSKYTHGRLSLSDPDSITRATGCAIAERFTFYDQRHITGSDILQPENAVALLTFGSRNLLRDILQGSLRMRQFMSTQKVFPVITTDVLVYFNSLVRQNFKKLDISDVIVLGALNEDDKQLRENIGLTYTKLDVKLRSQLLRKITTSIFLSNFHEISTLFEPARSLFIRDFSEKPIGWILEKTFQPANEAIREFLEYRKTQVPEEIFNTLRDLKEPCPETGEKTSSVFCFAPELLPKFDMSSISANTEMQLELNSLQLNEFELESLVIDTKIKDNPINFRRFRLTNCTSVGDTDLDNVVSITGILNHPYQTPQVRDMMKSAMLSTEGLAVNPYVSRDLVNFVELPVGVCPYALLSPFNREGTHMFVNKRSDKPDTIDIILVSSDVAQEMLQDPIKDCINTREWYLTDLMGNVIHSSSKTLVGKNVFDFANDGDILKRFYFNLLLFNGSLLQLTSKPELKRLFFKEWIRRGDVVAALSFLMARMRALQNKIDFVYDSEDALITTISRVINGNADALLQLINESYDSASSKSSKSSHSTSSATEASNARHHARGLYDKISLSQEDEDEDRNSDNVSLSSFNDSELGSDDLDSLDDLDDDDDESETRSRKSSASGKQGTGKRNISSFISISSDRNINPDKHQVDLDNSTEDLDFSIKPFSLLFKVLISLFAFLVIFGALGAAAYYYYYYIRESPKIEPESNEKENDSGDEGEGVDVNDDVAYDFDTNNFDINDLDINDIEN